MNKFFCCILGIIIELEFCEEMEMVENFFSDVNLFLEDRELFIFIWIIDFYYILFFFFCVLLVFLLYILMEILGFFFIKFLDLLEK